MRTTPLDAQLQLVVTQTFVVDNADVIVLFPEDGISSIQKAQLTSFDHPNCKALGMYQVSRCISECL